MFHYSTHLLKQLALRNITIRQMEDGLNNPDQISKEDGLTVYQQIFTLSENRYLLRIFVNETKSPPVVVTAYKTSKLNKYLLP